jgi:hypothetical protein
MKLSNLKVLIVSSLLFCSISSAYCGDADPSQTPSVAAFWDSVRRGDVDLNDPPRWVLDAIGDAAAQAEHHCAVDNGEVACQEKDSQFRVMKAVAFATKSCEANFGKEKCAADHRKSDPMTIQTALGTLCDANKYSHGDNRCLAAIESYELVQVDPDGQGILLRLYAAWAANRRSRQAEADANARRPSNTTPDQECNTSGIPVDEGWGRRGIGCLYQAPDVSTGGHLSNRDSGVNASGGTARNPGDHDVLDKTRANLAKTTDKNRDDEDQAASQQGSLSTGNTPPSNAPTTAPALAPAVAQQEGPPPPCTPTAATPCPKVSLERCMEYGIKLDLLTHSICVFKTSGPFDIE